jgi:hypothetical protein
MSRIATCGPASIGGVDLGYGRRGGHSIHNQPEYLLGNWARIEAARFPPSEIMLQDCSRLEAL